MRSRLLRAASIPSYWLVRLAQLAMSPFFVVRLDTVQADRIGHLISESDQVIEQSLSRVATHRVRNLIVFPGSVCNQFLSGYYAERFREIPYTFVWECRRNPVHAVLALAGSQLRERYFAGKVAERWYAGPLTKGGLFMAGQRLPDDPVLKLTASEMEDGWVALHGLGLHRSRPLICIHVRDNAYLPLSSYHDYRDPPLEGYEHLARHLIKEGYNVVRTGSVARSPMKIGGPAFLDYPFSEVKSDFMDVFLYAACELAVAGSISGIDCLAIALRKRLVISDLRPLYAPDYSAERSLFIFSRMRWEGTGAVLTIREMVLNERFEGEDYVALGIEFVPNTAEEIISAVQEMLLRGAGRWQHGSTARAREAEFIRAYELRNTRPESPHQSGGHNDSLPTIGFDFLERHCRELGLAEGEGSVSEIP